MLLDELGNCLEIESVRAINSSSKCTLMSNESLLVGAEVLGTRLPIWKSESEAFKLLGSVLHESRSNFSLSSAKSSLVCGRSFGAGGATEVASYVSVLSCCMRLSSND